MLDGLTPFHVIAKRRIRSVLAASGMGGKLVKKPLVMIHFLPMD